MSSFILVYKYVYAFAIILIYIRCVLCTMLHLNHLCPLFDEISITILFSGFLNANLCACKLQSILTQADSYIQ